ncbi:transglycosylase SLT domain-containing protein [Dechloromonas sp. XY25]|uniref:Transglycosylase SLT domain-containing protein n=1 Tax=Dechloromonas hankyongensis TaxID=2908002 RepID=A0ABS9JZZ9_9RHOO|nr:transglycosylase SLT domain-containing protein [Dechloromonas hankyongensis]MCG2576482.1 transglycosylase SLT domain-containing protein [Dechloromonas hankyongensis]
MNATTLSSPSMQRVSALMVEVFQKLLMAAGLVFIISVIGVQSGLISLDMPFIQKVLPAEEVEEEADAEAIETDTPAVEVLAPRLRGAMDYVTRRYKVSIEAVQPIFATAQSVGKELHIDPLLIIAVIGVESGFNPFSQSVVGAQGLMQVVPRYHQDKLPEDSTSFLDPVTNVQVGARVLKESIRRQGGLEEGLQQFGGAIGDAGRRYAGKVLAERQRLEQAAQRLRAA